jgi:hypothetical protein
MHHALLSLMLMSGACGDANASTHATTPTPVVAKCELPGMLKSIFVPNTTATTTSDGAERRSTNCQAM